MSHCYFKMAAPSEKLENCEVCAANKAKYTCPKCEVRTCCLTCVNIHKKELQCDGFRDKTKFVPLNAFTDLDLLSDYRLLEDIGRSVDQLQSDPSKRCTRWNNLPSHLMRMRSAAHQKGIKLEFMPQNFSRHKDNTTFFKWKTNELFWKIEWIFPQAENAKWITKKALDTTRLSDLLENILDPVVNETEETEEANSNTRALLREKLQFYRSAELTGIKVLLKAEKVKKSGSRFYELDVTSTLSENLANKTIIEYPTFYVILKDHSDMYELVDSDEEENLEQHQPSNGDRGKRRDKFNRQSVEKIKHKDNKNEPVNYFFNGELTDSDEDMERSGNRFARGRRPKSQMNIPEYNELVKMEH